jgi:hypothetical protein
MNIMNKFMNCKKKKNPKKLNYVLSKLIQTSKLILYLHSATVSVRVNAVPEWNKIGKTPDKTGEKGKHFSLRRFLRFGADFFHEKK